MAKKSNRARGDEAEDLACDYLIEKGYRILERNYYAGHSEVDIIAQIGEIVVFIEVKMRSSTGFGTPIEFVNEAKMEHIYHAAEYWTQQTKRFDAPQRFDVIGILKKKGQPPKITHLQDAYR
ncbi:MAG: YraN family protein [Balneolaceae bacterium]|nr:YraN family protein [Balneolaceae bacterium]